MAAAERGRTVFVRNISFDVDDKALEEAFNDVGPVRQAFIVKEKGQQRHKGYGYVQFALQEDAERAVEELHGRALQGRAIKVRRRLLTLRCRRAAAAALPLQQAKGIRPCPHGMPLMTSCEWITHAHAGAGVAPWRRAGERQAGPRARCMELCAAALLTLCRAPAETAPPTLYTRPRAAPRSRLLLSARPLTSG